MNGQCVLCGFPRAGDHEAWCPHFMVGPDVGGDPAEWPSLLDLLDAPVTEVTDERCA